MHHSNPDYVSGELAIARVSREEQAEGGMPRCSACRFRTKEGFRYCDNMSCQALLDTDVSGFEHCLQFMKEELGPGMFPKRRGFVKSTTAKRRRTARKHAKQAGKQLDPYTNMPWGSIERRFMLDATYREQMSHRGYTDANIHELSVLAASDGQRPADTYRHASAVTAD